LGEWLWKGSVRSETGASLVDRVGQLQGEIRPIFGGLHRTLVSMSEILKIPALGGSSPIEFAGLLHHLQPEKPGVEMKLRQ
jgi:hypothetical protein